MRLVDDTRVSLADLNHQVLFRERDLGKPRQTTFRTQRLPSGGKLQRADRCQQ
jgi:molybdopterin/thiamine biosynthesis adenylyltransferase